MVIKMKMQLLALASGMFVLGSANALNEVNESTITKIRQSKSISIGVREAAAPFASVINGVPQGYTVDICKGVVAGLERHLKTPLDIKYVAVSASNRIPLLKSGAIDMECGSTTDTRAREKEVAFTYPVFVTGARLAVRIDSKINDYGHLTGARVVVVAASSCEKLIIPVLTSAKARGQEFSISTVKGNNEGVLAVATGEADAFCTDDVLLAGAIVSNNLSNKMHRVSRSLSVEPYAVMVRKNDDDFLKLVDGLVAESLTNGTATKYVQKWFNTPTMRYKLNNMTMSAFDYPVKSYAQPE